MSPLRQKELFGKEASDRLQVIEAPRWSEQPGGTVQTQGHPGLPSWEIGGKLDSGVKPLEQLAELSGYKGPKDF